MQYFAWQKPLRRQVRVFYLRRVPIVVAAALALFYAMGLAADLLDPGIRIVQHPMSDIALGAYEPLFDVAITFAAAACIATAIGLRLGVRETRALRVATWLLAIGAMQILLLPFFPTDRSVLPSTWQGLLHFLLAAFGFLLCGLATLVYAYAFDADPHWRRWRGALQLAAWCVMGFVASLAFLSIAQNILRPTEVHYYVGLAERLMIGAIAVWLFLASLELRRIAGLPRHIQEHEGIISVA